MIVVFNKTDVTKDDFAKEWMTDFESFQMAIQKDKDLNNEQGSGYMSSLINSMSLMLEEFLFKFGCCWSEFIYWSRV